MFCWSFDAHQNIYTVQSIIYIKLSKVHEKYSFETTRRLPVAYEYNVERNIHTTRHFNYSYALKHIKFIYTYYISLFTSVIYFSGCTLPLSCLTFKASTPQRSRLSHHRTGWPTGTRYFKCGWNILKYVTNVILFLFQYTHIVTIYVFIVLPSLWWGRYRFTRCP